MKFLKSCHYFDPEFILCYIFMIFGIFIIGYGIYTYSIDSERVDAAYTAMNNGNYLYAKEQFEEILEIQTTRKGFSSPNIEERAMNGLNTANTLYHYTTALEYYTDENWAESLYHFAEVLDYKDSRALFQQCLNNCINNAPG